jgi:hypothetical protein
LVNLPRSGIRSSSLVCIGGGCGAPQEALLEEAAVELDLAIVEWHPPKVAATAADARQYDREVTALGLACAGLPAGAADGGDRKGACGKIDVVYVVVVRGAVGTVDRPQLT